MTRISEEWFPTHEDSLQWITSSTQQNHRDGVYLNDPSSSIPATLITTTISSMLLELLTMDDFIYMPENAQILSCSTVNVHRYDLVEPWASSQGCINSEIWAYVIIVRSSAYDLTVHTSRNWKMGSVNNHILFHRQHYSESWDFLFRRLYICTERISGVYDVFGAAH